MFLLNIVSALVVLLAPLAPVDGGASGQGKRKKRSKPVSQQQQKKKPPAGVTYLESEERAEMQRALEEFYTRVLADNDVPLQSTALIQALGNQYPTVKIAAAHFLGKHGERRAIPSLRGLLNDPDPQVKIKAAEVLLKLGDSSGLMTLVEEAKHKQAVIRLAAVSTSIPFAASASNKPQVVVLLITALRDEDKDVRGAAAAGLGEVGDPSAATELRLALAAETDETVKLVIEQQLRKLGQ